MSEIDETIERMRRINGVKFVLILNKDGNILENKDDLEIICKKSDKNLNLEEKTRLVKIRELVEKAKIFVRECEPNQITDFIKFNIGEVYDLMICPDKEFTLIVLQELKNETKV
mmetsp:Transcript_99289/g.214251  ORF Transcript_99289/g.214251 Transcript_99289/m.214251 type:complete len:114 (-) Transcript_99289:116-457(-)|eukprot:CAMPEP_0116910670 /NCGR_PEP_ID=MMETSP0467-20121206/15021_1 /TAXON_ID=283647 /ORGANISM="Mesodinium pulex, Strain SPMC105" /LENGTH=113 /DNA_ID=CAMNT_0004586287 /DNA_START=15 /DNA_END=356 /DNA_ORIENTATION=+